MSDDYLWDRSGEPDPEVERLEQVLGKYRYQAKPLAPALKSQLSVRHGGWLKLAAVAATILIALAGTWLLWVQNKKDAPITTAIEKKTEQAPHVQPTPPEPKENQLAEKVPPRKTEAVAVAPRKPRSRPAEKPAEIVLPSPETAVIAERQPIINPFTDVETARHIEHAQMLLRAFRNIRDASTQPQSDLSYEKQQSRVLLSKNILLRRDAEAKGNIPVEELLGSLEPFLLDIANLRDRPSNDDVRSIKQRMQKAEIVSALQIYTAPILSQVF